MARRVVILSGGCKLAYRELGVQGGDPVIFLHATPGSGLPSAKIAAMVAACGVRMVAPDRPGYGSSDPRPAPSLLDAGDYVSALADHLGLERFALLGLSAGGPFALGCAHALSDRVTRVALAASVTPWERTSLAENIASSVGPAMEMAMRLPGAHRCLYAALATAIRRAPERAAEGIGRGLDERDQATLATASGRDMVANMAAGLERGSAAWHVDAQLLVADWPFHPEEIQTQVDLWHGSHDLAAPLAHAQRLAEKLPAGRLRVCADYGHFGLIPDLLTDILNALTAAPEAARG